MQFEQTVSGQLLLAETLRRETQALTKRERVAEAIVIAGFVAAVAALFVVQPPDAVGLLVPGLCVIVLAVATGVRFHVPSGFTVPTQLAFVPLVFALPVALVPLAVVLSFALARLPELLAGRTRAARLVHCIGNSWFAIGPAAVFALVGTDPMRAGTLTLLLALGAQFALDFAVSSVRELVGSGARLRDQLREAWVYAVDAALSPVALAVGYQVHSRPLMACAVLPLLGVLAIFARERRARLESLIELKNAYHGTALLLGDVVEADDGYTGEHIKGVVGLALEVGERLGLSPERRRDLEFGALLHDVGKIAIPKEIINKPGKLDPDEWAIIKTHTIEGQRMLERVGGFMRQVGLIVRSHHERWDGGGYPDGLAAEEIPLESRIVACCDAWNAMRTSRSYRRAMSHDAAVDELVAGAARQFDPRIVEAVVAVVGEHEARRRAAQAPAGQKSTPTLDERAIRLA